MKRSKKYKRINKSDRLFKFMSNPLTWANPEVFDRYRKAQIRSFRLKNRN